MCDPETCRTTRSVKGVRPPTLGQIPQSEKNRRVCALGGRSGLQTQRPMGSIPITLARGMHRVREPRCIDDCAVRVASGSTMECSRPLIFSFSSHKEEKEKLPHKKKGAKGGSHPLPPPRDLDFPPFDEVAGHKLLGSRVSLVEKLSSTQRTILSRTA